MTNPLTSTGFSVLKNLFFNTRNLQNSINPLLGTVFIVLNFSIQLRAFKSSASQCIESHADNRLLSQRIISNTNSRRSTRTSNFSVLKKATAHFLYYRFMLYSQDSLICCLQRWTTFLTQVISFVCLAVPIFQLVLINQPFRLIHLITRSI